MRRQHLFPTTAESQILIRARLVLTILCRSVSTYFLQLESDSEQLLAHRQTTVKYFVPAPPSIVDLGIPTSFTFGSADVENQIKEEFGDAILAKIAAYDEELPVVQEQQQLLAILGAAGNQADSAVALKLAETIRLNPPPVRPEGNKDDTASIEYYRKRLARVDIILDTVSNTMGADANLLLQNYLLDREQAAVDWDILKAGKKAQLAK